MSAIQNYTTRLIDTKLDAEQRQEALKFVSESLHQNIISIEPESLGLTVSEQPTYVFSSMVQEN